MKYTHIILICFIALLKNSYVTGQKFTFTTVVDNVSREYIVHVPASYKGNDLVPLVFMLHGTSGDGEGMYNTSGWTELSEKEGFIAVFPSSLKLKIIDNGELKSITKWNTLPDADWTLQAGEQAKDDIKFLRKVLQEMQVKYSVDPKRVYLNGFSNGGSMASRCSIEMSDVLAAVCSNAAAFFLDTTYIPKRNIPFLFQMGNKDYGPGNVGPEYPPVPMNLFDTLISTPNLPYLNGKHYRIANNAVSNFSLNPVHTGIKGDTNFAVFTTYYPKDVKAKHEFKYIYVKDLGHFYPNWAAVEHWKWLKQFTLDSTSSSEGKKIRVVTKLEGVDREYYIHVPAIYDSTKPTPIVIMFHGGGHDGELFYNISGWNDVADTANIIVVYPSSLKYCIIEDGVQKTTSQWNNGHSGNTFCPNQVLKDDVLFVKTILQQMNSRFNIDSKRIYTVGFSNGGEFAATRTAIELSDIIAASISCGGGGALPRDTVLTPKRKLPVMLMFGNKDERMLKVLNVNDAVPMGFEILYSKFPVLYFAQVKPYVNSFDLDENNYTLIGDTNSIAVSIFKGKSNKPENVFWNVEVKDLEHEYPNGKNHALHGATYHWKWLYRYTLTSSTDVKEELKMQDPISIFPNPFQDNLVINVQDYFSQNMYIKLYNSTGIEILTKRISQGINLVENISGAVGLYHLMVIDNNRIIKTYKVLKNE